MTGSLTPSKAASLLSLSKQNHEAGQNQPIESWGSFLGRKVTTFLPSWLIEPAIACIRTFFRNEIALQQTQKSIDQREAIAVQPEQELKAVVEQEPLLVDKKIEFPLPLIGLICNFLEQPEKKRAFEPLVKMLASDCSDNQQEALKELEKTEEVGKVIREAFTQTSFVFPHTLKAVTLADVAQLDLSVLTSSLSEEAVQAICTKMPQLRSLDLSGNKLSQEVLEKLSQFLNLYDLNLENTGMNNRLLQQLKRHPNLVKLNISDNKKMTHLRPIAFLKQLQVLNISSCFRIRDLQPISACTQLHTLRIAASINITDLSPLASCTKLRTLCIRSYYRLTDIQPLNVLAQLQTLDLSFCGRINDLAPLASCIQLHTVNLTECEEITDLKPVASWVQLKRLLLVGCKKITDLGPLASCAQLHELDLSECEQIINLKPLIACTHLKFLYLCNCKVSETEKNNLRAALPDLHICDKI